MNENHSRPKIQNSVAQRDQAPALDAAVQREAKGLSRVVVRFTGYRNRPLDADNFSAGCKDLLDGLKHAGLLHSDDPTAIDFQTRQEKVSHRKDERTVIEIEYPE